MSEPKRINYEITWATLFRVVAVGLGLWLAFLLRDVLILLAVVFIFVAAVNPTIIWLQRYMSRRLAVTVFFFLIFLAIVGIGYALIPLLVHQIQELVRIYPELAEKVRPYLNDNQNSRYTDIINNITNSFSNSVAGLSRDAFGYTLGFFGGVISFVTGTVISIYLLLEEKNAREFLSQVMPPDKYHAMHTTLKKISERMGHWIRGQLLLMLSMAVLNFIAFVIIGVPTPLPLAIWTGLTEAIPYIGQTLGIIPAFLIMLASGNLVGALILLVVSYAIIQTIENNIFVPMLMGKATGLSPVLVILALVIGTQLFGLIGALISLPVAAIISVLVLEWPTLRKVWESGEEADEAGR